MLSSAEEERNFIKLVGQDYDDFVAASGQHSHYVDVDDINATVTCGYTETFRGCIIMLTSDGKFMALVYDRAKKDAKYYTNNPLFASKLPATIKCWLDEERVNEILRIVDTNGNTLLRSSGERLDAMITAPFEELAMRLCNDVVKVKRECYAASLRGVRPEHAVYMVDTDLLFITSDKYDYCKEGYRLADEGKKFATEVGMLPDWLMSMKWQTILDSCIKNEYANRARWESLATARNELHNKLHSIK